MRSILLICVVFTQLPGALHARKNSVSWQKFNSRAALKMKLGDHIAQQLPTTFDFTRNALIWVDLPSNAKPHLQMVEIPSNKTHYMHHSRGLIISAARTPHALSFILSTTNPCSGGMTKPPKEMKECIKELNDSMEKAKETLLLFATPRAKLKHISATQQQTLPRP